MPDWTVVAISGLSAALVSGAVTLVLVPVAHRHQRRLWRAEASQRLREARTERAHAAMEDALKYGQSVDVAYRADVARLIADRDAALATAQKSLPDIEARLRMHPECTEVVARLLALPNAYRLYLNSRVIQVDIIRQQALARAADHASDVAAARTSFDTALADMRTSVQDAVRALSKPVEV